MTPCIEAVQPWWHWHPGVGAFIGILGGLGILVPILREKMRPGEKVFWSTILLTLTLLELRSIHLDGIEHDEKDRFARCEQVEKFNGIADALSESMRKNDKSFHETLDKTDKAIKGIGTNLDAVTGSKSYPLYEVMHEPDGSGNHQLFLIIRGKFALKMQTEIQTIEPFDPNCRACAETALQKRFSSGRAIGLSDGDMIPEYIHPLTERLPLGSYQLQTFSQAGTFTEILTLAKGSNGQLDQSFTLYKNNPPYEKYVNGKMVPWKVIKAK